MPYKFTPEYSILSSIRKELDPVKELASSAEKLAKSSEERSQIAERLAKSSEERSQIAAYSKMIPERTNKKFNIANTRATSETVIFDGFFSFLSFFILPPPFHLSGISRFLIL